MGFGDFLKAGASALGVDTEDIGGFFDKAQGVLGGEGDAGDLFGAAAQQFGIDTDDLTSTASSVFGGGDAGEAVDQIGQLFGGGGGEGGGAGGGFGGVVSDFFGGGGDIGGAAEKAIGGFGSLFGGGGGGGDIVKSVSDLLPSSVTTAFSEAADLPFVQDAANGNWAEMAGSVPGLNGALGSFGLSTKDVAEHIEGVANQAVGGGSAWSFGNMLADQGSAFLEQVAAPVEGDGWASLPGFAQKAGVDLPGWATGANGLIQQGGHLLEDGGFVPAQVKDAADLFDVSDEGPSGLIADLRGDIVDRATVLTASAGTAAADDTTGEFQVATEGDASVGTFDQSATSAHPADEFAAHDEFEADADVAPEQQMDAAPPVEPVEPTVEEAPAPPPEQFAAADQLEGGLDELGDEAFS